MKLLIKPLTDYVKAKYHDVATQEANDARYERNDAGLDLYCPEKIIIEPGDTRFIDLMIQCEALSDSDSTKNVSYYLHCRSSISKTPLRLANSVGIIDSGYRGNIMAAVDNRSNQPYTVERGTRLFQITGRYLESIDVSVVDELSNTERGNEGFGSTGE
jgi:dUTP pyrophosphatase